MPFIPSSDFFLRLFFAFFHYPLLRLLLKPPQELVHLSSGSRPNTAGEGSVVLALHLVKTQQKEAQSFWAPDARSLNYEL